MASKSRAWMGQRNFIVIAAFATAGITLGAGSVASGAGGGGVTAPKPPQVTDLTCVERCAGLREAATGGRVQLSGRRLGYVEKVRFPAKDGAVTVKAAKVANRRVIAKIPDQAANGKPRAIDEFGQATKAPTRLTIVPESKLPEPGSLRLADAQVSPQKAYFAGAEKPTLRYIFNGDGPTTVRIDLVRKQDNTVVRSWVKENVEPNSEQTVRWNGLDDRRKAAKNGEYGFRVGGLGDPLSRQRTGASNGSTSFGYYDHKFPVRGKHYYGDGIGAGRGHQGQDVFAKCGTPLEAARGGKVKAKAYHGRAGYYLVITGKKNGRDYVYMHLKRKSPLKQGERVKTGQKIGEVGETGNASGCHLHFELWSKPGWYSGGSFMHSVTKHLKRWDRWS